MTINPIAQVIATAHPTSVEIADDPTCYLDMPSVDDFHKPSVCSSFSPIYVDVLYPFNWLYVKVNLSIIRLENIIFPAFSIFKTQNTKKQKIKKDKEYMQAIAKSYASSFNEFNNYSTHNKRHSDGTRIRDTIYCKTNRNINLK